MAGPRRDTRGIIDAPELFAQVRFRRREPAAALRPYLEHYWLIDWDLTRPYVSHLVPHPSVNVVFQRFGEQEPFGEVAGIGLELFTQKLEGRGLVRGVQFRPGGFRPFAPQWPVSRWTGQRLPVAEALPTTEAEIATILAPAGADAGTGAGAGADDAAVAALDTYLLGVADLGEPGGPAEPDPQVAMAMRLADRIRTDRTVRRVASLAETEGISARSLQRLFATYVGVGPKWVILRYRIHEALERAESSEGAEVDWAELAAELGYSDQAHLVRDFTATVGVPPTAYAR
ncbi:helix-turn-helix domain-containing protein [Streptomyces sp. NBC_00370]|uniref:helix-turn-helix domain-containing protein n=1 Tax=Streptomyces sp. NBC_00370 TaxID=2975728 RepID=UPI002E26703F